MKLTHAAEALLSALAADTTDAAHAVLATSRAGASQLSEMVQTWPDRDLDNLCKGILNQVRVALAIFHAEADDEVEALFDKKQEQSEEVLIGLVYLIKAIVEQHGTRAVSSALQEAAQHLHDQAILMADGAADLQEAVVRLCSLWWHKELPGRNNVVPQMIPYLLYQATVTGRASDVKRCYSARGALALLDFEDPSIQGVQALMVRAAMLPPFLRSADGRKFIAHLFTLHPKMVYELTAVILNQIVSGRKSVLDAYGEIVFKAWRGATGSCLERIETHLIQNSLIKRALRASSPALAASLRRVLDGLHSQRLTPGTDAMLLRLYHPLLFRDLAAANAAVRNNAMHLLVDVFPLQDSSASPEECDEVLQRQFEELSQGLSDDAPAVRITAAGGICSVLNVYWELLPAGVTATYLKRLTDDMARDSTSPSVRQAAVQGLIGLVDNPLAQPLLKLVLPRLGALLHDSALKVRVATADLLLVVIGSLDSVPECRVLLAKTAMALLLTVECSWQRKPCQCRRVRELHFADIVDVQQLLEVMAHDAAPVAERTQRLLLPSYFPEGEEGPARVAMLLRQDPLAGKAFCACLVNSPSSIKAASGIPVERAVDLASALLDHLLSSAPAQPDASAQQPSNAAAKVAQHMKQKKGRKRKEGVTEVQPSNPQESLEAWEALLDGLAELCTGSALAGTKGSSEGPHPFEGLFPQEALVQLLDLCQTAPARGSVLRITAALSGSQCAVQVQKRCAEDLIHKKEASTVSNSELLCMLRCIFGRKQLAASFGRALLKALQAAAEGGSQASPRGMPLLLALRCLDEALQDADLRSKLLDSGLLGRALPMLRRCVTGEQGPLAALSSALDSPFPSDNPTRSQTAAATSTAPMLVSLYCRAALHLQLAAANSPSQPAVASSANDPGQGPRAVPRSQNRQANIATGTFGQQQAAVVAGEEARDLEEEARDEEEAGAEEDDGNATVAAAAEVAVQEGCTCVLKLQGRLQAVGVSGVAALMVQSAVQEPPRKKGRAGTATPVDNDSCRSCIEACHAVAQALLAVAGDASCTLQWTCSSAPVPAIFQVAHTMLQWHEELIPAISEWCEDPAFAKLDTWPLSRAVLTHAMRLVSTWQGHPNQHPGHPHQTLGQCQSATWHPTALGPSTAALSPAPLHSQTVTQLYPEANADAAASVCENVAACEVCESLHKVVEALVRQGSCDTNMLMFMEYHLPGLLSRLAHNGRARWLLPIVDLLGKRALQLAPASSNQAQATSQHSAEVSSRQQVEHQSELAAQPNDSSPAADPANADKENVSVNQPVVRVRRGRKGPKLSRQHEMLLQQPGFVINFLTAAEDAKVQHLLADQALQVASQCWHDQHVMQALGAAALVEFLGVTGPFASRQGQTWSNQQGLQHRLHVLSSTIQNSSIDSRETVLLKQKLQGLSAQ